MALSLEQCKGMGGFAPCPSGGCSLGGNAAVCGGDDAPADEGRTGQDLQENGTSMSVPVVSEIGAEEHGLAV